MASMSCSRHNTQKIGCVENAEEQRSVENGRSIVVSLRKYPEAKETETAVVDAGGCSYPGGNVAQVQPAHVGRCLGHGKLWLTAHARWHVRFLDGPRCRRRRQWRVTGAS